MTWEAGQRVGRYRILRTLGSGAMGVVYLAEDPEIERRLAIKTVRLGGGFDDPTSDQVEDRRQRLLREARTAGSLIHPNVVTLFDAGREGGALFLAFEYVDGPSLADRLRRQGLPTTGEALRIVGEAARGLGHAHEKGIVHRDVKPANLLLDSGGRVKVSDFGIAKLVGQATELTMTGTVVGSPHYLSPEQVRGEELDPRSDVFSLGVVLYELLGGRRPFEGETLTSLLYQILHQEPPPIGLQPGLLPSMADLLSSLLAKDREHRLADGDVVADAIETLAGSVPGEVLEARAVVSDADIEPTRLAAVTGATPVAPPAPPPAAPEPVSSDGVGAASDSASDLASEPVTPPPPPAAPEPPPRAESPAPAASATPDQAPEDRPPAVSPSPPRPSTPKAATGSPSRWPLVAAAAVALMLLIVGVAGAWWWLSSRGGDPATGTEDRAEVSEASETAVAGLGTDEAGPGATGGEGAPVEDPSRAPAQAPPGTGADAGTDAAVDTGSPDLDGATEEGAPPRAGPDRRELLRQRAEQVAEEAPPGSRRQRRAERVAERLGASGEAGGGEPAGEVAATGETSAGESSRASGPGASAEDPVVIDDIEVRYVDDPAPGEPAGSPRTSRRTPRRSLSGADSAERSAGAGAATLATGLSLTFRVDPADAFVLLDGRVVGRASDHDPRRGGEPYALPGAGTYRLVLRSPGHRDRILRLEASADAGETPVTVRLERAAAADLALGDLPLVRVRESVAFEGAPAGARVSVDGRDVGAAADYPGGVFGTWLELSRGRHRLSLTAPGHRRWDVAVDVSEGAQERRQTLEIRLEPEP